MSESKTSFMDKFQAAMEKYLVPIGMKIASQRHLAAIRDGLTSIIPMSIIGGFACLLAVPPVPSTITEASNIFYAFLLSWSSWASDNYTILMIPYYLTIGCISIYVVAAVAYQLAKSYNMDSINNMFAALLVFLCVSNAVDLNEGTISISRLGASYMFGALAIAILVVEVNRFFIKKNIRIKMPEQVPPNVAGPFNVLISLIFSVVVFSLLNALCTSLTGDGLTGLIYTIFTPLISATGSLPSVLLLKWIALTFWFFGIHGDNMVSAVTTPIITAGLAANMEAYIAGEELQYIYAGYVGNIFGGWITYSAMLIVIFTTCKSAQLKSVAKVGFVPSCFNINETSVFGIPTVLNVYAYIPSLITGFLNYAAFHLLAEAGLVGKFFVTLPFTVPGPLAAFLGSMDVRNVILWVVLFVVNYFILLPFMKAYDKQLLKQQESEASA